MFLIFTFVGICIVSIILIIKTMIPMVVDAFQSGNKGKIILTIFGVLGVLTNIIFMIVEMVKAAKD